MKSYITVLALVAVLSIAAVIGGAPPAHAQGTIPAPANVNVADSENPGDVIITWDAVPSAAYYRIGWVAYPYVEISEEGGRPWSEAFAFFDVENIGQTSRTIRRLTPGVLYAFRVASNVSLNEEPSWSGWVLLDLAAAPAVDHRSQYPNCDAVREHFPGGVRQGSPIYRSDLDRDGDGIACEPTSSTPSGDFLPIQSIGTFTGTGNSEDVIIRFESGSYRVITTHNGNEGLIADIRGIYSNGYDRLADLSVRGDRRDVRIVIMGEGRYAEPAGDYLLLVEGDGDWEIRIDRIDTESLTPTQTPGQISLSDEYNTRSYNLTVTGSGFNSSSSATGYVLNSASALKFVPCTDHRPVQRGG